MTTELAPRQEIDSKSLLSLVTGGDCSKLTDDQKLQYYRARCESAGLDYRAQPFSFITLNGKLTLYALKGATDQLASKHGIVCEIISQVTEGGMRVVTVRSRSRDGRQTDEIGVVSVEGMKGDHLANAMMKAVTKAKRRAVLSLSGLGMLDETELETIPGAAPAAPMPRRKSEAKPVDAPSLDLPPLSALSESIQIAEGTLMDAPIAEKPKPKKEKKPELDAETFAAKQAEMGAKLNIAIGRLVDVKSKSGPTWVRFTLKVKDVMSETDGEFDYYGTFDKKLGELAESLKGKAVEIYWHLGKPYKDAQGVEKQGRDVDTIIPKEDADLEPKF